MEEDDKPMAFHLIDESFDYGIFAGASCAFGVFDGLHCGHKYLVDCAIGTKAEGARAIAITFDIDPDEVFHPQRLKKLMRNADRLTALQRCGVDDVVAFPFVPELYSLDPMSFLAKAFPSGSPSHMHVGEDFRFGAKAAGTVETLQSWGAETGCEIHAHHLVSADGSPITATRIRKLLFAGDVREATRLLGHPYSLRETVRRGRGEGADFGFATANLQVKPHDRVLGDGVYAAYALVGEGRWKAAVSVGVSPTFEETAVANVEAHILDFDGDIAGQEIELQFVEYLRPMMKFDSTEELIATVMSNIEWVRQNL